MEMIILVAVIVYIILAVWCWYNLGGIEKNKKIIYILVGLIVVYIITCILYNISKSGIQYQEQQIESTIGSALTLIFTGLNGLIIMPYIAKQLDRVNEKEIEKEEFNKKILLMGIIFLICLILECGYLKDTQEGILKIYNSLK